MLGEPLRWARFTAVFSLKIRAILFALAMLACAVLPASYALVQTKVIDQTIEQANAAGDVRRALEDIEDLSRNYAHFFEHGGTVQSSERQAVLDRVIARLSQARLLVAREVAVAGPESSAEEQEELAGLDAIERAVRRIGPNEISAPDALIQAAIANERAEVKQAEQLLQRKLAEIEVIILFETLIAAIFALALLLWFRSSLVLPLERLSAGAAKLGIGQYHTRIEPGGVREIDTTIGQFNHMAEQIQVQNNLQLANNEELEAAVARQTADLREAHDALAALATHRADFLADISHELRTPIAIVRGEADVTLRNRKAGLDDYRESLERVARQAEALTQLVDDLLFVARQGAGSPSLKLELCDLAQIARFAADDVRGLIEADGGGITVQTVEKPVVHCDQGRIGQVLRILIDNAIRYCGHAPQIAIAVTEQDNGFAIAVRDNGVGIAAEETRAIFERFKRGGNQRELPGDGTGMGLGLPLAKSIIEAHGGSISCQSAPGEGTVMTFTLNRTTIRLVA